MLSRMLTHGMELNFKKHSLFRVGIWDDWETDAYLVAFHRGQVYVKKYGHCSCYDSEDGVLGGDYANEPKSRAFSSIKWDWQGPPAKFAEIAKNKNDLKYPRRKLDVEDYDYTFVAKLYKIYLMWFNAKKPAWKDRIFKIKSA